MKVEFALTKASAALYLKAINDALETKYVDSTGALILMRIGKEIAVASEREEHEEIDRPTVKEIMACETFEHEKINYNPTWGRDVQ